MTYLINKMKKNSLKIKGFTLIEIMVATSIFMVIMLIAMGALISSSDTAKKAQALRSAMDNVNFAMESMARSLRTGTNYECIPSGNFILPRTAGAPFNFADCTLAGSGGSAVSFMPANNPPSDPHTLQDTAYLFKARTDGSGTSVIQKCTTTLGCVDIVASNVDIKQATFYVAGSDPTDAAQPSVYITIKGTVKVKGVDNAFAIQTMASQRSSE